MGIKYFLFLLFILVFFCRCSDNDYVSVISFELEGKNYFFPYTAAGKSYEYFNYFYIAGFNNKERKNSIQINFIPGKSKFNIQKDTLSVIIVIDNTYYLSTKWPNRVMYVDSTCNFELEIKSLDENSIQGTFWGKIVKIDFSEQQPTQKNMRKLKMAGLIYDSSKQPFYCK